MGEAAEAYWEPTETYLENGGGPQQLPAPALTPPGRCHLRTWRKASEVIGVRLRCAQSHLWQEFPPDGWCGQGRTPSACWEHSGNPRQGLVSRHESHRKFTGVSSLLASLGHTGRRVVRTQRHIITKKSHHVLSKFTILCWAPGWTPLLEYRQMCFLLKYSAGRTSTQTGGDSCKPQPPL